MLLHHPTRGNDASLGGGQGDTAAGLSYIVISSTRLCDDDDMAVMDHGEQIRGSVNTQRCGDLPDPPLAISPSCFCDCRGRRRSGYVGVCSYVVVRAAWEVGPGSGFGSD